MSWKDQTVLDQRLEFVMLASRPDAQVSALCRRFGISRKTGYKWLARLLDRSRRPAHSPEQTDGAVERAVVEVRLAHPAWGGRKIVRVLARDMALKIAPSTVTHVLHRHGLISAAASGAATPWQRFEHEQPNSLWQMDFKGHFATDSGRCHTLTVLDDHSRFNLVLTACANEQRAGVERCLREVFERYGLPYCINTDNGSPWGSSGGDKLTGLGVWLTRLGVKLSYSTPMHPQTNGKEERFHRTLKAEVLQQRFIDLAHVQRALDAWRDVYNLQRPHQAIGMEVPAQRYRSSLRSMPATLPPVEYAPEDLIRKVSSDGDISLRGHKVRVSGALKGQPVALRPRTGTDGIYDLYFCHHRITEIDLRNYPKA